jgi:cytochrome P450
VVTRYDDVKEVLADHEAFRVTEVYAERMARTSGAFILGMEDTETFRREVGILRKAVRPGDLGAIREIVEGAAGALIREAAPAGRIDLVGGLTRAVALRVVRDYFGVPGPDEATLARWMRTIFWEIFLDPLDLKAVRAAAETSSAEMLPYLDALIAERRRSPKDDFLGRLIAMQGDPATRLDDAGIRRNIGGLIVGAVDTTSKAASQAIAYLIDHPDELRGAQRAARTGQDDALAAHVFEALRFNPQAPLLLRHCGSATTVARGTPRATVIPAGSLVVAATLSASFDPEAVEDPERFRVDRADRDLFHFGHGQHLCFGRMINHVQLPAVAGQVLRLEGLRRAPGADGVMRYEGPFPDRMIVEFDGDLSRERGR